MKLPLKLDKDSREPIYYQIEQQIKTLIASGYLAAGSSLPSIRMLAKDLEISVITTRRAYQNLENNRMIKTIQGKGTFVAEVAEAVKKEVQVTTVNKTFEEAIELALHYGYTTKEINELFQDVLTSEINKER